MKKLISVLLVCILSAGSVLGCVKKETVPARGFWDGRTYTNVESGIRLTVPEKYHIDTDEELIKWCGFPDDYYNDLVNKQSYYDIFIEDTASGSYSRMYIEYSVEPSNTTAEGKINQYKSQNTRYNLYNNMDSWFDILYGDNFKTTLCGETYICCGFTLRNLEDTFYQLNCYRVTSGKATVFIEIRGKNEEAVNAYLSFFETERMK